MKKSKVHFNYRDIECDSKEETDVLKYLFELQDVGIIKSISRAESFVLSGKRVISYQIIKQLKKSSKIIDKEHILIREHIYTPDFKVIFDQTKDMKFLWTLGISGPNNLPFFYNTYENGYPVVYIEVKPQFDQNNMSRLFKVSQKWMYEKYKLFVNLIIPTKLFESTFTPKEYFFTPTGKQKKINFKTRTLEEYLAL